MTDSPQPKLVLAAPLCPNCLAELAQTVAAAPDGAMLAYCKHHRVLARVQVAGNRVAHWFIEYPVDEAAAMREFSASEAERRTRAN